MSNSRRTSVIGTRRESLRHLDDDSLNKLKIRHDSNARRTSLAELIPDWPTLQKIKKTAKVKKEKKKSL